MESARNEIGHRLGFTWEERCVHNEFVVGINLLPSMLDHVRNAS